MMYDEMYMKPDLFRIINSATVALLKKGYKVLGVTLAFRNANDGNTIITNIILEGNMLDYLVINKRDKDYNDELIAGWRFKVGRRNNKEVTIIYYDPELDKEPDYSYGCYYITRLTRYLDKYAKSLDIAKLKKSYLTAFKEEM